MVNLKALHLSVFVLISLKLNAQEKQDTSAIYFDEKMKIANIYALDGQLFADTALTMNPKNADIWHHRAVPYLKNGEFPTWIPYINKAVELKPERWLSYRGFCKMIFMKDYENALLDFDAAQALTPNTIAFVMDHTLEFFKSLCYLELGQIEKAKTLMEKSIDWQLKNKGLDWTHYVDLFYLGVINFESGDLRKAEYYINLSLDKYKQFPDANYYKALILNKLGRKGEALEFISTIEYAWSKSYRMNEDNEIYSNYPKQIGIGEVAELKAILSR